MDPVSQAVLGASAAQSGASERQMRVAAVVGILGGMAPDLDVLIRSPADPLLFLEYHRHFTHALLFIPVGSLLVAAFAHALFARRHLRFRQTWLYAALGYATHGLLDACTTYGTQLLWPFSDARIAWNLVSVIDPLFTLPVLLGVVFAMIRRSRRAAVLALAWSVAYPMLGLVQRERAEAVGLREALARGHAPIRLEAKPSFANILLWKVVYETEDRFHVDTVRAGLDTRFYPGESVPVLDVASHFPWLSPDSQQALDVERFRWFSNGYLAPHPRDPLQVIDMRYSMVPNEIEPLWTIRLDPRAGREAHVEYLASRDTGGQRLQR
ncbi:MAG: metal-dependent hydrolase, partial [Gammaproteobacteria bacterium]